jgi:hypothetical protein
LRCARDCWYCFQPGHQVVCHFHSLDMNDFGFSSAFKRIGQVSQRIADSKGHLHITEHKRAIGLICEYLHF